MNAPAQVITPVSSPTSPSLAPYWGARLRIGINRSGQRSILEDVAHEGPLRIQRPFYPEGSELCHLYLLHPPGGLVSGDHLRIDARVASNAGALITTPSASKVYRANTQGTPQVQQTRLEVEADGSLEWLPQETILFDQAAAVLETEIHLQPASRMIAWELICLGRPHCNERFDSGFLRQRFSVWSRGVPLYLDHFSLTGGDALMQAPWGLQGLACVGTAILACGGMSVPAINSLVDELRQAVPASDTLQAAVTRLRSLIVVRLLGADTEAAKQVLERIWVQARPVLLGRDASIPRIWNT